MASSKSGFSIQDLQQGAKRLHDVKQTNNNNNIHNNSSKSSSVDDEAIEKLGKLLTVNYFYIFHPTNIWLGLY